MEMETLFPSTYIPNLNMLMMKKESKEWSKEENKKFERALAIYDEKTPDRWAKVAAMIPGKSVSDVMRQYLELEADVSDIEAGLVPIPGCPMTSSSFTTMKMVDNRGFDDFGKRHFSNGRSSDQERKKGVPWTEDEHRRFLMGLQKHGKGDWRNISRNFVISKTPTQVASHAQKYFIRQNSGGKDKKRPSIHDITTVDHHHQQQQHTDGSDQLIPPSIPLPADKSNSFLTTPKIFHHWNNQLGTEGAAMVLESSLGEYEIASQGLEQLQNDSSSVSYPICEISNSGMRDIINL